MPVYMPWISRTCARRCPQCRNTRRASTGVRSFIQANTCFGGHHADVQVQAVSAAWRAGTVTTAAVCIVCNSWDSAARNRRRIAKRSLRDHHGLHRTVQPDTSQKPRHSTARFSPLSIRRECCIAGSGIEVDVALCAIWQSKLDQQQT